MPRMITRPTMPLPDLAGDGARAGLQVVAQPVDPVAAPRPYNQGDDIVQALAAFHPALDRFMSQKNDEYAKQQVALGAKARLTQDGTAPAVMTPEQDPYWQQGYMKQHGVMAGQAAASEMQLEYEKSKNSPDFNPDTFFSKFTQQDVSGLNDKDALAGYIPHVTNMEGQLRADFAKTQLKEVRDTQDATLSTGVRQMLEASVASHDTPEVRAQRFESLVQQQAAAQNSTRPEVTEQLVREMSAKSNLLAPEDFDFLFKEGVGGRSIADSNGKNGVPVRAAIEAARSAAQVAQSTRIGALAKQTAITNIINLDKILETDPLSLGDPWKIAAEHSGPNEMFQTGEAAAAWANKAYTAQQKVINVNQKLQAIANHGSLAAAMYADDPDVKKAIQKQVYDPVWAHNNPNDPVSVANTQSTLLKLYSTYHVLDTGMESLLKNSGSFMQEVDTAGPNGKVIPGPSPEFKSTYNIFKAVKGSDNPSLIAMMPKEARTMFATYDSAIEAGRSEIEAFRTAKLFNSDDGKLRIESQWNPAQKVEDINSLTGKFTKTFSHVGAGQANEMARKTFMRAQEMVAMSPNLDRATAVKQAVQEMQDTHVYDGVASYVPVPPGVPQENIGGAVGQYVEAARMEYKKLHGIDMGDNYYVQPVLNGENTTYRILDGLHTEVMPPRKATDLIHDFLVRKGTDIGSTADAQAHNADLNSGAVMPSGTDAAGMGLSAAGFPDANFIKQQEQADMAHKRGQTGFREGQIHGLTEDGSLLDGKTPLHLGAQIPQPGGLNMNAKDYALDALHNGNPDFALTAFGEGLRLSTYKDQAGKRTIGLGYNIDSRSPDEVSADFKRMAPGITPERTQRIVDGQESITPKEAQRLYEIVKPQYVSIAKSHFGPEWDQFPSNVKAVLTDMAYNGGNQLFGPILADMKAKDYAAAAQKVTVSYHPNPNGPAVLNNRRIALWRGMLAGQSTFEQMLNQGA